MGKDSRGIEKLDGIQEFNKKHYLQMWVIQYLKAPSTQSETQLLTFLQLQVGNTCVAFCLLSYTYKQMIHFQILFVQCYIGL